MVLGNNGVLVDGKWSNFWFLGQYIFKDVWMDGLLSRWFRLWVQMSSPFTLKTPCRSLQIVAFLRSQELLPNPFKQPHLCSQIFLRWFLQTASLCSQKLYFFLSPLTTLLFALNTLSLSIPFNSPSHALKTLSLSIPSNNPSHALKTLSLDSKR